MPEKLRVETALLGVAGAIVGGAAGYLAFFLLTKLGLYALVVPGALLGVGCRWLSRTRSRTLGIACAILATLLGLFVEWQFRPFIADDSLMYFLAHIHKLRLMTLVMIAIGATCGYWFGSGG